MKYQPLMEVRLERLPCHNGFIFNWKWSWRYLEWQKCTSWDTVHDFTRNPFRVWRDR